MRRTTPAAMLVSLAAVLLTGCEPAASPHEYHTLAGRVAGRRSDTGELSVRLEQQRPGAAAAQIAFCVVTADSEIYINDQFATIEAIRIHDAIELVGYRDPDPRQERFVVSFAYIDRRLTPPPLPDLPPPTTRPASQPGEE